MNAQRISWTVRGALAAALLSAAPLRAGALTYHALEPCRIVDTRATPGGPQPLAANETRAFDASGSALAAQGGTSATGGCLVPPSGASDTRRRAEALAVNLIAVNAAGPGDLRVFPGSSTSPPLASVLNYTTGQTVAVGTTIPLRTDAVGDDFKVRADVSGTHVVIDVVGYYSAATSTTFVSRLRGLPASTGAPVSQYGAITGVSQVNGDAGGFTLPLPWWCTVQKFKVALQTVAIPAGGGTRAYLLKRDPDTVLLNCDIGPAHDSCESPDSVVLPNAGGVRLFLEAFSAGPVPSTDALIQFDAVCE